MMDFKSFSTHISKPQSITLKARYANHNNQALKCAYHRSKLGDWRVGREAETLEWMTETLGVVIEHRMSKTQG